MSKSPQSARTRAEIAAGRAAVKFWTAQSKTKAKDTRPAEADTVHATLGLPCNIPMPPIDKDVFLPDQVKAQIAAADWWFEPITITRMQIFNENRKRAQEAEKTGFRLQGAH